jgi:hypothetical protein
MVKYQQEDVEMLNADQNSMTNEGHHEEVGNHYGFIQ